MTRTDDPSRAFRIGVFLVAAGLVSLSLWVASREWFSRDDFAFLAYVRSTDPWSWQQVFLPAGERFWTFYRPLSMETFFWLGHRLFGLEAFGYFALSLTLHFASGLLFFRLARQLGFGATVAAGAALLAVSRAGSLDEIYYGSVFMYVGEVFFSLVAATALLAHLRSGREGFRLLSCLGLLLALLCNEHAVTLLGGLVCIAWASGLPLAGGGWRRLLRALWLQTLFVAVYLLFRFGWLAPAATPELYRPELGVHVLPNAASMLSRVFGGAVPGLLALALAVLLLVRVSRWSDADVRRWLWRVGGASAAWLAAALAPFALLSFPQGRWAMPLAVPVCLLLGALIEAFARGVGARRARAFEWALLGLVVISIPYAALLAHARDPLGGHPRRIAEWIESEGPRLSQRAVIVWLFGAPGLADPERAEHFRYLAYGGGVLNAVDPATRRVMRFYDASRRAPRNVLRPDSVYLALAPDLSFERADPALLDRLLRRRFGAGTEH